MIVGIGENKLVEKKMSTSKDWIVWCNSKKEGKEDHRFEHYEKKLFSSYNEKKSKGGDEQEKKKKKKAGQSVRYRLWWKQGNIKMAASKNYSNCWVHKDFLYTANSPYFTQPTFEKKKRDGRAANRS